jgi:uroporphyrinogen-III synthase
VPPWLPAWRPGGLGVVDRIQRAGDRVRVIVTRPAAQAAEWVELLTVSGIAAAALPLIGIAPVADPAPLQSAWAALSTQRLAVFVSPNAADQFFSQRLETMAWPLSVLAGSPGPGTTRVLLAHGVPAACVVEPAADATQFDSESLWLQLADRPWGRAQVLIVRGDGGREWLADTLRDAGAEVTYVSAYRRTAPVFDARMASLLNEALAEPAAHLWFFSSSEAIDNLAAAVPAATSWHAAHALATHPRIAERARGLGFGRVDDARPTPSAVIACIQSTRP